MKDKEFELTIDTIGFEGIAIARKDGQVCFVKGGVPGDKVLAKVRKINKRYMECSILDMIEPSPHRIEPMCKYYGSCGGCTWQCLTYEQQLHWKKQHTIDAYKRIGKIDIDCYMDTLPSINRLHYRNKMDFSFSASRWLTTSEVATGEEFDTHFALGLHIPGRYDKVIDIENCEIQPVLWNDILDAVRKKALEFSIEAYDTRKFKGFLKGLTFRHSVLNNETMLILITADRTDGNAKNDENFLNWFRYDLRKLYPSIVSLTHCINNNNAVNNGDLQWTEGREYISEKILGIEYRISPFSFFQTNTSQLDTFITKILDAAKIGVEDMVWDLYCGTGSITLPASKYCKEIYGFELVENSIDDAKKNAVNNGITNAYFFAANLNNDKNVSEVASYPHPDTIILDPPRSGLHPDVVKLLLQVSPERIVYVSCNPTTQARDLAMLQEAYTIASVQPIDMFPHTYHIEVVTELIQM
ncbi:MAG: 23S rRNA (uracil(1939)-C(5))-methyltransferase RlmD [Ignavibacteria bacterium]|nr:23S rRNA (uracil(1939)-C(5))-methyltransferase RlmD [Ignavibacteria bacterium]